MARDFFFISTGTTSCGVSPAYPPTYGFAEICCTLSLRHSIFSDDDSQKSKSLVQIKYKYVSKSYHGWFTLTYLALVVTIGSQVLVKTCQSRYVCFAILSQAHSGCWHWCSWYRILCTLMPMLRQGEDITIDGRSIWIPIHRLPPEILSEIFLLLPSSCTEWYDVFDMSRPPWSLGHVYSSWRSTVVSSCWSIWSNLWIPFSSANGDIELCNPISLLQKALEQSGNHELSFSFSYDVKVSVRLHNAVALFQLLLDNSCRWCHVKLSIEPLFIWSHLDSIYNRLPSLTDLTIFCNDRTAAVRAFGNAPRLRHVNICSFSAHSNMQLPLNFSQIVSYVDDCQLSGKLIPYFLHIIKASPHLHTFSSIMQKYNADIADIAEEHVQSSSLWILSACDGSFLQNLQLPLLEVMHIDPGPYEPCQRQTLPGLCCLLINSRCPLVELTITDAPWWEHHLHPWTLIHPQNTQVHVFRVVRCGQRDIPSDLCS